VTGSLQYDGSAVAVGFTLPAGDPVVTFVPTDDPGTEAFSFTTTDTGSPAGCAGEPLACAPALTSTPATVTIVFTTNTAPVCSDGMDMTPQGHGFATTVDCVDAEGDPLTFAIATYPEHGLLQMISEDTFEYTAPTDYLGPDPWTFTASDGMLTSALGTYWVTVVEPVGCTTFGTDGDDHLVLLAEGEWFCGGAGDDSVDTVAAGAVFEGGDGNDFAYRNEGQVWGDLGDDGVRDNLGGFAGGPGSDYVVWNEGSFQGEDGADWVTWNFGEFDGGPDADHVDVNWPEGTFFGGDGVDTVDDNQGIFDPGPQ
jgi:hypothetical protein